MDKSEHGTVIDNRTMDARPTYGPIRTYSCTIEQRRRDRLKGQSEPGHRQENNGGETDLPTNQNTVIDKTTMEARPTYGPSRTRSSTRKQWRQDRPTDQSEHGHRQENNGGGTVLRTTKNTVIDSSTLYIGATLPTSAFTPSISSPYRRVKSIQN